MFLTAPLTKISNIILSSFLVNQDGCYFLTVLVKNLTKIFVLFFMNLIIYLRMELQPVFHRYAKEMILVLKVSL